jgi:hypothetical protein
MTPEPTETMTPEPEPTPTPQDCCSANGLPGCDDPGCVACVCGIDGFCCSDFWDSICADEALNQCAGSCACAPDPTPTPDPTETMTPEPTETMTPDPSETPP